MGHAIGQEFALAGFQVNFFDQSPPIRQVLKSRINKNLNEMLEWKLVEEEQVKSAMTRVNIFSNLADAVSVADLVVEAVFEVLEVKQQLFTQLDQLCPANTILASNTSSLMPSSLAASTQRPEKVLVLHYFYPPHLMPLVEIVKSSETAQETADAVYEAVIETGKKPIVTEKEALGFVANRLQAALLREAMYLIEQGICSPQDVDIAVKFGFGRRLAHVGPIELAEVQDGWLQMSQIAGYIFPDLNNDTSPSPIIAEKIAKNELGPQTGKGFYEWSPERVAEFERQLYEQLARYIRADHNEEE